MAMDQQAQLNAPDPRETRPPCYEDALLLPRLDGSFASLNELGQKKEFKLGVHVILRDEQADPPASNTQEEPQISSRNRCRSEEVLSMRDVVTNRRSGRYRTPTDDPNFENHHYANISRSVRRSNSRNRNPTSPPPTRIPTPPPDLPPPPPIPSKPSGAYHSNLDLHYHSTEILHMYPTESNKKPMAAPLSPVLSQGSDTNSAEYDDLQDFKDSRESPYSRRKSRNLSTFKAIYASAEPLPDPLDMIVVEDHYPRMVTPPPKEELNSSGSSFCLAGEDEESFVAVSDKDLAKIEVPLKDVKYTSPAKTAVVVQVHNEPRVRESDL